MSRARGIALSLFAALALARAPAWSEETALQKALEDLDVGERWIYGDFEAARARAARQKKPIFALFR